MLWHPLTRGYQQRVQPFNRAALLCQPSRVKS